MHSPVTSSFSLSYVPLEYFVYLIINLFGLYYSGRAVVSALATRPDAFTAADAMSKGAWVGITGASFAVMLLNPLTGFSLLFFAVIAWVAVGIYLADVRPRLQAVLANAQGPWRG